MECPILSIYILKLLLYAETNLPTFKPQTQQPKDCWVFLLMVFQVFFNLWPGKVRDKSHNNSNWVRNSETFEAFDYCLKNLGTLFSTETFYLLGGLVCLRLRLNSNLIAKVSGLQSKFQHRLSSNFNSKWDKISAQAERTCLKLKMKWLLLEDIKTLFKSVVGLLPKCGCI